MPYIVAIIWILLALAAGYWVGKYGFAFPPGTFASSGTASASDAAKDEADIRAFIQRYFSTWSAKDIAGYGACFQENATIAFVDQISDEPVVLDLKNFLESQRKAHETADVPMTETSESVSVQLHGRVAHVQVRWVLKKDGSDVRGWDFYTLVKAGQNWKIMHLSFFNDE
jgi:ketosteroid isomerase-like protein